MGAILISLNIIYSFSTIFLILLILLILGWTYFYYRRTIPDLNTRDKILLYFLRILSLIFIVLSTGELAIEVITSRTEKPVTAIIVDNSKSIQIDKDIILEKLPYIIQKAKNSNQNIEVFFFDDNVKQISIDSLDKLNFEGHSTNISKALSEIIKNKSERNYQNLILITDGIYNSGENPIYQTEKLEMPAIILGVGDPKPKNDISIDDIVTNDIVYAQNQTPVKVNFKSNGFENKQATISFFEDKKLIEKRTFTISGNYQEIEFNYTPETEGEKKLNFSITPLSGEYTEKNNFASKYIKVLGNRIKVLTIAGKPSYDLSFINQAIKSNKDFQLETLIEKPDGDFYPLFRNERFLDSANVIFFVGFPAANNSERFVRRVLSRIEKDNVPLFVLVNPDVDFNRLSLFKNYIPFDWRSAYGTASQIFIDVPEDKSKNEILNIASTNSAEVWNTFPPIFRVDREFLAKPESEVLSFFKLQTTRINQPLIISRNLNKHRSIAFLGFNIWRLKLLNAMKEEESIYFDRFINNSIKWLTSKEIEKNLKVKLNKKIFDINEKVNFIAQFYDEANQPVDDAQISLDIFEKGSKISTTFFKPLGNGIYSAEFENLNKGDFEFQASTEYAGKKYSDNGRFSVTETELEYRDLTMREDLLKRMALITNGTYTHISNSDEFIQNLSNYLVKKEKPREVKSIFYAWNSTYVLIILILFLSLEWFLRKRWGLL